MESVISHRTSAIGKKVLVLTRNYSNRDSSGVVKDFISALGRIDGLDVQLLVRDSRGWRDPRVTGFVSAWRLWFEKVFSENRIALRFRALISRSLLTRADAPEVARHSLNLTPEYLELYSTASMLRALKFTPDFVFVLIAHRTYTYRNFSQIYDKTGAKIFLIPWDMNFLTGGCHYAWSCLGFKFGCVDCYVSGGRVRASIIEENFKEKARVVRDCNISLVYVSRWLDRYVDMSPIWKSQKRIRIGLPIDEEVFSPMERGVAREMLGVPRERPTIIFGALSVKDPRKGFLELMNMLDRLSLRLRERGIDAPQILVVGRGAEGVKNRSDYDVVCLGLLTYQQLSIAFSAADVFVCPSVQDAGPMMINQSLMCGTPVASFEMGAALDLVHDRETGYKVPVGDAEALAIAVSCILSLTKAESLVIRRRCRSEAVALNSIGSVSRGLEKLIFET